MTDFLDFDADEFMKMMPSQRARMCRLLAARAKKIADRDPHRREHYLQIAKTWIMLAEEIELQHARERSKT
jgi:hypothetical protein